MVKTHTFSAPAGFAIATGMALTLAPSDRVTSSEPITTRNGHLLDVVQPLVIINSDGITWDTLRSHNGIAITIERDD